MRNLAIDMEYAKENGILVCGTDMVPHSTYEHTWALILALAKNIPEDNALLHSGGWQANSGIGLKGKTLGVLGLGKTWQRSCANRTGFWHECDCLESKPQR